MNDWAEWQSYRKDRGTPPWIKVYRNLLSNKKWASLSDAEKGHLVSIWLVAADSDGQVPNDAVVLRKICQLDETPNIKKFIALGWMTPSGCQHDAKVTPSGCQHDAPETEAESETETETETKNFKREKTLHETLNETFTMIDGVEAVGSIEELRRAGMLNRKYIRKTPAVKPLQLDEVDNITDAVIAMVGGK